VAQDLADLNKAGARAEHLGRRSVPQPVRAQLAHAGALAGTNHDMTDRRRVHRAIWGAGVHEHVAALAAGPPTPQVSGQRLADIDGDRQPIGRDRRAWRGGLRVQEVLALGERTSIRSMALREPGRQRTGAGA
jgi:hypothetical protein